MHRNLKRRVPLIALPLLLCLLFSGCGEKFDDPRFGELELVTVQEYDGDTPVSAELTDMTREDMEKLNPDNHKFGSDCSLIKNPKKYPERGRSYCYRLLYRDGRQRTCWVFGCGEEDYLEEDGRFWHYEKYRNSSPRYLSIQSTSFPQISFTEAFGDDVQTGDFKLSPMYNGSGKAVCLDITGRQEDPKKPVFSSFFGRNIPDGMQAERAEDVRYIVFLKYKNRHIDGYWYNVDTGEKVSDSYDYDYEFMLIDLVTGERDVFTTDNFKRGKEEHLESFFAGAQ